MRELLFTIDEMVNVRGRGFVLFPGPSREARSRVGIGQRLAVTSTDGTEVHVTVADIIDGSSVVMAHRNQRNEGDPLLIAGEANLVAKIEPGCEVWLE